MTPKRRGREAALILAVAVAVDLLLGEPESRWHPVNWIGTGISRLEQNAPRRGRVLPFLYGTVAVLGATCLVAATARTAERALSPLPPLLRVLAQALLLKPAFALRMLLAAGSAVQDRLADNDLAGARAALTILVSRDTSSLSEEECAAAAIESLAENSTDSIAGPWLGFALFGLPGAWAFRTINTFDSRWGYHGAYEWLGRCAAKLDDAVAWVPARVSAILLIAAMPLAGGNGGAALRAVIRDRSRTASPNAGWTMSAMAGGLGVRLSKPGAYTLNDAGRSAGAADIRRAGNSVLGAATGAIVLAMALRLLTTGRSSAARRPRNDGGFAVHDS